MSRQLKTVIALACLVVMALLVAFIALTIFNQSVNYPPSQGGLFGGRQVIQISRAEVEFYFVSRTILSTINITLLIVLIITYASIYLKTKSNFTIGLLLFAGVFLIKDIASSPLLPWMFGYGMFGYGPFALWFVVLPDLFELIALSVLMYLSIKY